MPSPFPGMNPYLESESAWTTFRVQFICEMQSHLVAQLRHRYSVRIGTREYIHEVPLHRKHLDVPYVEKVRHLLIHHVATQEIITVIEFLSPVIKLEGPHRETYSAVRTAELKSPVHFVEIDLLRGGSRMPPSTLPDCDYYALVSRANQRPRHLDVWQWNLRNWMPVIPIPLKHADPDITLELKAVLDRVYDAGGYAHHLYDLPPEPRLAPDDAAWAVQFLPTSNS